MGHKRVGKDWRECKSLEKYERLWIWNKQSFWWKSKNYIRPVSRFDEVDINDLSSYTSAEHSGKSVT